MNDSRVIELTEDDIRNDTLGIVGQHQRELHAAIFRRQFWAGIAAFNSAVEPTADEPIEVPVE